MFRIIPLLIVPLAIYNLMLIGGDIQQLLATDLFSLHLLSGAQWTYGVGDAMLTLGLFTLYVEIFKSTRTGTASVLDHSLSMLVFIVFLVEFLVVSGCGTSTFFLLGLMSLIDVVSGFTVSIVAARRDFGVGGNDAHL